MKLSIPGLLVLGVAGLAATALAGYTAGTIAARNPEGARRLMRRAVREASRGLEHATRLAAEAREQFGDLVAEAKEEARADAAKQTGNGPRAAGGTGRRRNARRSNAPRDAAVVEPTAASAAENA
jgi:hypothetical protein